MMLAKDIERHKGRILPLKSDGKDRLDIERLKDRLFYEHELVGMTEKYNRVDYIGVASPAPCEEKRVVQYRMGADVRTDLFYRADIIPVAIFSCPATDDPSDCRMSFSYFFATAEEAVEFKLRYL